MTLCINPQCSQPNNPNSNLFCASCDSELLLDGQYRVLQRLGGGGFGETYEVIDDQNVHKVLKILTLNKPEALRLFKKEYEVLSKLNHPGIPKVDPDGYFTFTPKNAQQPLHCLIMEKIEGQDLAQYLTQTGKPISQKLAFKWLKQLAEILDKVHTENFFHRDIKPPNIMLRPTGQLVLIDFGTVKEITATFVAQQEQGRPGTIAYTPGYAPPEQEKGFTVSNSDFFALGRTFVHLLTNKYPLAFYNPHSDELIWRGAVSSEINPLLLNFVDELMGRLSKERPYDTRVLLNKLRVLEQRLYPSPVPPQPIQPTIPVNPVQQNQQKSVKKPKSWTKKIIITGFVLCIIDISILILYNYYFDYYKEPLMISLNKSVVSIPDPNMFPMIDDSKLDNPKAQKVIQKWLDAKKVAFGKDYQGEELDKILVDPLLSKQKNRVAFNQKSGTYYEYEYQIEVTSVKEDETDPLKVIVTANLKEIAQSYKGGSKAGTNTDDLIVQYDLFRKDDQWFIQNITVK